MDEIHSVAEYIDCLKRYHNNYQQQNRKDVHFYYRGEPNDYGETAGQPSIGRSDWLKGNNESNLFRECERRLPHEFAACKSTFEKLVKMQHYMIPTRLLDISLDPLVGLFFALYIDSKSKDRDDHDAVILIYEVPESVIKNYHSDAVSVIANISLYQFDDFDLSKMRAQNEKEFNNQNQTCRLIHEIQAEKSYFNPCIAPADLESVYCVHPLMDNPRIRAQQGAFLLFGINGNKHHLATLDSSKCEKIKLRKIRIPQGAKCNIRKELTLLSRTIDTIYPDFDGVSDYMFRFYGKIPEQYYQH